MSCCGGNRARLAASYAGVSGRPPVAAPRPDAPRFNLAFEYVGHAPLMVVGPASGQRYRFTPGAILAVDPRDRPALETITLLRRR